MTAVPADKAVASATGGRPGPRCPSTSRASSTGRSERHHKPLSLIGALVAGDDLRTEDHPYPIVIALQHHLPERSIS